MRYVTIDLFGKVNVGKTTIFQLFTDKENRFMEHGGNLSYDQRTYYARCWIFPRRWEHSMVFFCDPKFEMRWKSVDAKYLKKMFEPTNVVIIVTDSTKEDVQCVKQSLAMYPKLKLGLIIFIIANMQDKKDALSVEEIKKVTGINDVLGISATRPDARAKVEPFLEDAVKRYFLMLSRRGEQLDLI